MPNLSTFAVANETTVTTIDDTRTHIIAGVGSNQRAFVIDDVVDDAPGYTLVFCNNCYPQFQNPRTFTFGDNANETRIVEAAGFTLNGTTYTAAAQVGRTTYFSDDAVGTAATGGRFRPLNQTHKVTIRNVKWGIESAGSGFAAARSNGFHFGGGLRANLSSFPATTAADGMPMVCNGLRVYGRHGNSQMINKNLEVVNNETLGYGLRMELWDSDAENLTFVLGFGAVPNTQYTGFQLARYNSSNVLVQAGFQMLSLTNENVIPADGALTFEGANVSGADMFNSRGGGNGSMVVNFIDPVGEPGRAVASLRRGNIRIFRTQRFNYTGAVFASGEDEHLVIDQTTSGAPSWATPANLTSHSGGTFSQVLAVKQMPNNSGSFGNVYNNYRTFTVGYGYRRQSDTFSIAVTGALPDRNITLTPDFMADGSRITSFTPDQNDEVDTLDELKRAAKTREVSHPHLAESEAYILTNANNEYEIKQHNGTAGNVLFTTAAHSSYFTTTSSGYTIHNADGSVTAGNAAGLRGAAIQLSGTGLTLDFPRADNNGAIRRVNVTGTDGWRGALYTSAGTNLGGLFNFAGSNLTHSVLTSHTGGLVMATTKAGNVPGRQTATINSADPLTVSFSIAGGVAELFASTGGAKYSATKGGTAYGVASFDTSTWASPTARIEIADRQIDAQAAYSIIHTGLLTLSGLAFVAAGGAVVNAETIQSSGEFLFLNGNTLLKRQASGYANAALTAEPVTADGVFVDDVNGDVPYIPGISLAMLQADVTAVKDEIVVDYDTSTNGRQNFLSAMNNLRAGHGQILSGLGNIEVDAPTAAQIVTAIQAADFGSAAGTQTLQTLLGNLLTAINSRATNAGAATAVWGHASDIDTGQSGVQTPAALLVTAAAQSTEAHTAIDSTKTVVDTLPTATENANATLTAMQTTDIDSGESGTQTMAGRINAIYKGEQEIESAPAINQKKAIQTILGAHIGKTTLNADGDVVTTHRVDTAGTPVARTTVSDESRTRTAVTILSS